jgi:hypothetical protein
LRVSDGVDPEQECAARGLRTRSRRGSTATSCEQLQIACATHTDGGVSVDPTIGCCLLFRRRPARPAALRHHRGRAPPSTKAARRKLRDDNATPRNGLGRTLGRVARTDLKAPCGQSTRRLRRLGPCPPRRKGARTHPPHAEMRWRLERRTLEPLPGASRSFRCGLGVAQRPPARLFFLHTPESAVCRALRHWPGTEQLAQPGDTFDAGESHQS